MKVIVGGTFDETGGKPSYLVDQLATSLGSDWLCINGGYIEFIREFSVAGCSALVWMPNISNDVPKTLNSIKEEKPDLFLVQSKRVIERTYTAADVISRMQKSQSDLGIMITKPDGYHFDLFSQQGSILSTDNICDVGVAINACVR